MPSAHETSPRENIPPQSHRPWRLRSQEPYLGDGDDTTDWEVAERALAAAETVVLATADRETGRPHAVPVLAVWAGGALHVAMSPASRKARNLATDPRCTVVARGEELDVVVEGTATGTTDATSLAAVAAEYADRHGWEVAVRDGAFHDAEGAPTAGPPPYEVKTLEAATVFGFPLGGDRAPTRWRFEA